MEPKKVGGNSGTLPGRRWEEARHPSAGHAVPPPFYRPFRPFPKQIQLFSVPSRYTKLDFRPRRDKEFNLLREMPLTPARVRRRPSPVGVIPSRPVSRGMTPSLAAAGAATVSDVFFGCRNERWRPVLRCGGVQYPPLPSQSHLDQTRFPPHAVQ